MNRLISNNIDTIRRLCEKYEVKSMYLFGSGSIGEFSATSDVDILITFQDIPVDRYTDNYFDLHYELEDLFKKKIDLITERSLSNPYLIQSIEKTKQLLYAA